MLTRDDSLGADAGPGLPTLLGLAAFEFGGPSVADDAGPPVSPSVADDVAVGPSIADDVAVRPLTLLDLAQVEATGPSVGDDVGVDLELPELGEGVTAEMPLPTLLDLAKPGITGPSVGDDVGPDAVFVESDPSVGADADIG